MFVVYRLGLREGNNLQPLMTFFAIKKDSISGKVSWFFSDFLPKMTVLLMCLIILVCLSFDPLHLNLSSHPSTRLPCTYSLGH